MPELPEVETVRAKLAPALVGRTIEHAEIHDPLLTRPEVPEAVAAELVGERIEDVRRRGKYLIFVFESGRRLLVHLRMTGTFELPASEAAESYRRAVLTLDDGSEVLYRDMRRFGIWVLLEPGELDAYLDAKVGGEPLDRAFTTAMFARALAGRRAPIKGALLDQRAVAGVGNIYADEALWRARLHPLTPAGELAPDQVAALRTAVRHVLRTGLARHGATLRTFRDPDGRPGRMQTAFRVYGRTDEPCERCGTPIAKTRVAGRGTWYCPSCQQLTRDAGGRGRRTRGAKAAPT